MPSVGVTRESEILTVKGYVPIAALENKSTYVWDGKEYSLATVKRSVATGPLVRVWFEDGGYIDCGEDHPFYDVKGQQVKALGLRGGTVLETSSHPTIHLETDLKVNRDAAYVAGYATFAGYEDNNRLALAVSDDVAPEVFKRLVTPSVDVATTTLASQIRFEPKSIKAGYAPLRWRTDSRLSWLGGAMDAAADWLDVDGEWWLTLGSTDEQLVREMRRLGRECGLMPRIRIATAMNAFMLNVLDTRLMIDMEYILVHDRKKPVFVETRDIVADVHPLPWQGFGFHLSSAKRGRFVCNGVMVGGVQ